MVADRARRLGLGLVFLCACGGSASSGGVAGHGGHDGGAAGTGGADSAIAGSDAVDAARVDGQNDAAHAADVPGDSNDARETAAPVCMNPAGFTGQDTCDPSGNTGSVAVSEALHNYTFTTLAVAFGPQPDDAGCTSETFGACVVTTCPLPHPAIDGGAAPLQAGRVTVSSGLKVMMQDPDPKTGAYTGDYQVIGFWPAGAPMSFSAAGGTVPAFTGSFCSPAPIQITSPAGDEFAMHVIDRSKDFTFSWTGGDVGEMYLETDDVTPSMLERLSCTYPVAAQTGLVPKEALTAFPAGYFLMSTTHLVREVVRVGGTCVTLSMEMINLNSAGTEGSFGEGVTLQ
jgi:hypothetical protein